jgi:hypothetical protein
MLKDSIYAASLENKNYTDRKEGRLVTAWHWEWRSGMGIENRTAEKRTALTHGHTSWEGSVQR